MINSNVSVKLQSFEVPSLVQEVDPYRPVASCSPQPMQPSYPQAAPVPSNEWIAPSLSPRQSQLSEVPAETLEKMCEDFKQEVFKRAGKSDHLLSKVAAEG